jgi:parvulin-like peptidyl-prolyl isomerase
VKNKNNILIVLAMIGLLISACVDGGNEDAAETATQTTATPTEAPLAARVNGEGILLSSYQEELQRFQAAAADLDNDAITENAQAQVLDFLIEQMLFSQAALENGYAVSDEDVSQRITELAEAQGGQAGIDAYLTENFYTQESFRSAVARELAVVWMRNYLIDQIPTTAEQVHARQIIVDSENAATAVLRQLEVGKVFTDLAFGYDPLTGGDLGWFPRGYLFQPAVEDAAFSLAPGQFSGIIQTNYGYHLIEVIERDPQRQLSADALLQVQRRTIDAWLQDFKTQSAIEIYLN